MADSQVVLNPGAGGAVIATDLVTGKEYQIIKIATGGSGVADEVTTLNPMPVTVITSVLPTDAATAANQQTDALTDAELRAAPVAVSGDFYPATQPVSGTVSVDNFPATQAVSGTVNVGNLPATQPVSGTVAVSNFPATQPISAVSLPLPTGAATAANQQTDALTDTQLRATPVPVSGTVTANTGLTQPLTDTQLRASAVPVIQAAPTVPVNGRTTVTTAGTRVVLAGSTTVKSVTIKALGTNTGIIYVGDSAVSSSNGFPLYARDTISMDISNLNTLYIDSSVNNEGIAYIAVN